MSAKILHLRPLVAFLNPISQSAYMRSTSYILRKAGVDVVGKPLWISSSTHFDLSEPNSIRIEHGVVLSEDVVLLTHDFSLDRVQARRDGDHGSEELYRSASVTIGEYSFIGYRALVMPGVHIAPGCIIGAGSIVTKSTDADTVYAGNPAKPVTTVAEYWDRNLPKFHRRERRR